MKIDKDLKEIGESYTDLTELNELLDNRFNLNLFYISRKGWRLAGFLSDKPIYSICWVGLGVVEEIFNNPISKVKELIAINT